MKLKVEENNYLINIGYNTDDELIKYLEQHKSKKICLISDENVYFIYRNRLKSILHDFNIYIFTFSQGEKNKSLKTYEDALMFLSYNGFTRNDLILSFGGGITGDLSGYIAATYLRGISFVSVPTTLLSMIDSSVGGKNGVNLNNLKNQVGTFYFPDYVHIDYSFLKTLDKSNINNGLAEMFKYSVLNDKELFNSLKKSEDRLDYESAIYRSLEIKLDYVRGDEHDKGKRQYLNLGHTIGHGIEALSNYDINHGEAVGIGLIYMARASYKMGIANEPFYKEIIDAFKKHGLKTRYDFNTDEILNILMHDKKIRGDSINIIIPVKIGEAVNKIVDFEELKEIINLGKDE